jgi:hypothetical protein
MALKSSDQSELKSIEKLIKYQLPNKFKAIGFGIFIVSLLFILASPFILENYEHNDLLDKAAKSVLLLGLLAISISREKVEDELIIILRMKSYSYAFIGGVLYVIIMPFINYLLVLLYSSNPKIEGVSDFTILGMLLTIQIFSFRSLKRSYNEE